MKNELALIVKDTQRAFDFCVSGVMTRIKNRFRISRVLLKKGLDERELVYSCDKKSHVKKYRMTEAGMAWYREDRISRGLKL